jgi:uncharacterized protein YfaS (alpha-2-macroglobulin family)
MAALVALVAANLTAAAEDVARPAGAVLVPDRFLRSWDPVTIFFDADTGPAAGGSEDDPGKYATVSLPHPGAFTWLGARTLQFRPAEPWPPLTRFTWTVGGRSVTLATLMSAPSQTIPANGATDLDPVTAIALTLREPLDASALAKLISIELRPLPGVEAGNSRTLDADDFDVKAMERTDRSAPAQYIVNLHDPISGGTRAILHLKLSLEDGLDGGFQDISFATAAPFRISQFGCTSGGFPVTVSGSSYGREQAIACAAGDRALAVQFSASLAAVGPIEARNLLRITPQVDGLAYAAAGNTLSVTGQFRSNVLYQVRLEPSALHDARGRALEMGGPSEAYLSFAERESFLKWKSSAGIVERFGPQMLPLQGRGFETVDIRIHKIDPLDRSFWPFPSAPVTVDDAAQPPAPGEQPPPFSDANRAISADELAAQVKALGSPSISALAALPLRAGGSAASFGLDLAPYLERIGGKAAPGTYLIGLRRIDSSTQRMWVRVQVTDLSLTTIDESDRVRFVVTSLATGAPVAGAHVTLEGSRAGQWITIGDGHTGDNGQFGWNAPGQSNSSVTVMRIVVAKDDDRLVLDPTRGPDEYADNNWQASEDTWLQWTQWPLSGRSEPDRDLAHLFTERPIYRPDEPVHIKGYLRGYHAGALALAQRKGELVVTGPDQSEWRYPLEINGFGSFYHLFNEKTVATGDYQARAEIQDIDGPRTIASITFKKEAYRLPTFEVRLGGPDRTASDKPFQISLAAAYYAGGVLVDRPVRWRVTQFPYDWALTPREGFFYSTDARFSGGGAFQSSPVLEREARTDAQGAASLDLNPAAEPTAQPRSYVVEATVVGDDDQSVTSTQQVVALPPFALGVKVARYVTKLDKLEPEVVVQAADGKLLAGENVTVRLLKRRWNSQLQAGDFTQGSAKYVTETVDEKVSETAIVSGEAPTKLDLPLDGAGVYIVEVEARDRVGRTQTVSVDLFADGGTPVTWSRAPAKVFKVTTEKAEYAPGETAMLILESPFQTAEALAIVEEPDGRNRYEWVPVRNGVGRFPLPVEASWLPRLPVHFVLMRGRLKDVAPVPGQLDLGKPETLAATSWVVVKPVKNIVNIKLDYPEKAQPGDEIDMTVTLSDDAGQPLAGEVTLWLVDQAVLALAREQPLDPLPSFIIDRGTRVKLRDTRTLTLGALPLQEEPGGGEGAEAEQSLLENVSIRKNFTPVPYYNPDIIVGADGVAHLKIKLADSLTVFKLRAKAVSGPDRFGFATGTLKVRLPVMVQPVLPRFVRPGDEFTVAALGRIIEGNGGAGRAEVKVDGLALSDAAIKQLDLSAQTPVHIEYGVTVPTPTYTAEGQPERQAVTVTLGIERSDDGAKDAFSVNLPLQPDRRPVAMRQIADLAPDKPVKLPAITEPVRTGTLSRTLLVSSQPALLRMSAALDYLQHYPYGCTEQRISNARAELALRKFRDVLLIGGNLDRVDRDVTQTLDWIDTVTTNDGLVSFWPGSRGYVFMTAWTLQFLVEARGAGYPVKTETVDKLTAALTQSLRSDYTQFVSGLEYAERVWALTALAEAGRVDAAYVAELATRTQWLDLEGLAQVSYALQQSETPEPAVLSDLTAKLWQGVVIRLFQGRKMYGGLQSGSLAANGVILPSETRTVAQVLRAAAAAAPDDERRQLLVDALVTLGSGDGWGTTNANAEALLALSSFIAAQPATAPSQVVDVSEEGASSQLAVGGEHPMVRMASAKAGVIDLTVPAAATLPLTVLADTSYLPVAGGSTVASRAEGFVVTREILKVQADDVPPIRIPLDAPDKRIELAVGDVVEEHVELVNPQEHNHVAIVIPLAAGMEPLNPNLATAPPEAKPLGETTLAPSFVAYLDDQVAYFYDALPQGTYSFAFRTRAQIPGTFTQPPAYAEMMYDGKVNGNSNGSTVVIQAAQ